MTQSQIEYQAAIGRFVGKVDTDSGGLARYSYKIQLPPAIRPEIEPEISLEYYQGAPNGSLGIGWALGGRSCIRRAPSNLANDGINPPPATYDRSQPKLTLDGAELLCIAGSYFGTDAKYTTEVDNIGRIVVANGSGFILRDSTGRQQNYGLSNDSRVVDPSDGNVREWHLSSSSDYYGNTVTYTYTSSPQGSGGSDVNTCYLKSIRYTSNSRNGFEGKRIVNFEYSGRSDKIIQIAQGVKCTWASLLTAIRIGVVDGDSTRVFRSYELAYSRSESSFDSRLISITETAPEGSSKIQLLPSRFGYTTAQVSKNDTFKILPQRVTTLPSTRNNVGLLTMNVSGRCLSDIVCMRYDQGSKQLTLKTYLANRKDDGTVDWNPSTGAGSEARLPFEIKDSFPNLLSLDMSNDGRADFIVPHPDKDNRVRFSISQCTGTGYQDYKLVNTRFPWTDGSKFITVDGPNGNPCIVQVWTDMRRIAFRNFRCTVDRGTVTLQDAIPSSTGYDNVGTIDWFQLSVVGTGERSLVRVWMKDAGQGQGQVMATAFLVSSINGSIKEITTSKLGQPTRLSDKKYSVLSCDLNADGVQDIILGSAEYTGSQMSLSFDVFFGTGLGGFQQHGSTIKRVVQANAPLKATEYGQFHMTNINGSNYPSLCYVYQTRSKAFTCISANGCSDGLSPDTDLYELTTNSLFNQPEVIAADLNGNGMVDWLFYTLDSDIPRIMPAYNSSKLVDFLDWTEDSMGLRTQIQYGCLSDERIYTSGVNLQNYTNNDNTSYPVIAAPNYVVTSLDHRNNPAINSFDYRVQIQKTYEKARISTLGRGWLGFEKIHTLNKQDGVLTTETYRQSWPFNGSKLQIDTKTSSGKLLRIVRAVYDSSSMKKGPWNVYRTYKVSEQTQMLEDGAVLRSNDVRYAYDQYGNMTLRSPSETQRGRLIHQSWKRCAYTTIDGITGVLVSEKLSSIENNLDMSKFEPGDVSLMIYQNDKTAAILRSIHSWSSDHDAFTRQEITIDGYGRRVRTLNPAGLEILTSYDDVHQTFPVAIAETGPGIASTSYTAYDEASGLEVAKADPTGIVICYGLDAFGRTSEVKIRCSEQNSYTIPCVEFLRTRRYLTDSKFAEILSSANLRPERTINFERIKSPQGAAYLSTKIVTYAKDGIDGQHEVVDYVDCIKNARKRSSRHGTASEKVWTGWEYNSKGQYTFESFPATVTMSPGDIDWVADARNGVKTTFDTLGRSVRQSRPFHNDKDRLIVTSLEYLDGGAMVREQTLTSAASDSGNLTMLSTIERRYLKIGKDELVIENKDGNGLLSILQYDARGNLTSITGPNGQKEVRKYNSRAQLISMNNLYQNNSPENDRSALLYQYNAAGHLISESNAAGEAITYVRDAKGRSLEKRGADGRTIRCVYDQASEGISSISIDPDGSDGHVESRYDFSYDECGRFKERKLTLGDGQVYTTGFKYDWQGQLIEKRLAEDVSIVNEFRGAQRVSSSLSHKSTANWTVRAETSSYSPYGRPEKVAIQGTGLDTPILHDWRFDSQGFPDSHGITAYDKYLVLEQYLYNGLDQMTSKHDMIMGTTTRMEYNGLRLGSYQSDSNAESSYEYDSIGNMIKRGDTEIKYTPSGALGSKGGTSIFEVSYDAAGRTIRRNTDRSALNFTYDSLGALTGISDSTQNASLKMLADYSGQTLRKTRSDGASDIFISEDMMVHINPDGRRVVRYHLLNHGLPENCDHVLATVSQTYESTESKRPLAGGRDLNLKFTDVKGNVTHIFNGRDASLLKRLEYDPFGLLGEDSRKEAKEDSDTTFEGTYLDELSGLLNFGARWYDPLLGRFLVPDDILDIASLLRTDGLNRYAFENNDPINNIDPTGHWSMNGIMGLVISCVIVAAAVAVTIATGGAAAPLAGAIAGALFGAGIAGITYSIKHQDEEDGAKFLGGFLTTLAINAAIGAVTGALGSAAAPARMASALGRIAIRALAGAGASILATAGERHVENEFYGAHHDVWEGAVMTGLKGAATGVAIGWVGDKFSRSGASKIGISPKSLTEPKTSNQWIGLVELGWKSALKNGGKALLKPGGKLGLWAADQAGATDDAWKFALTAKDAVFQHMSQYEITY